MNIWILTAVVKAIWTVEAPAVRGKQALLLVAEIALKFLEYGAAQIDFSRLVVPLMGIVGCHTTHLVSVDAIFFASR